jgi:hypothetical protein
VAINGVTVEDYEWMKDIEEKFQEYIMSLYDQLNEEDYVPADFVPLSGEPFCGCETCNLRETLTFLIPYIIKGYEAGKLTLEK